MRTPLQMLQRHLTELEMMFQQEQQNIADCQNQVLIAHSHAMKLEPQIKQYREAINLLTTSTL